MFLSVCVSVCLGFTVSTDIARKFIFSIQIHLDHIQIMFENQGHWAKVKVSVEMTYFM